MAGERPLSLREEALLRSRRMQRGIFSRDGNAPESTAAAESAPHGAAGASFAPAGEPGGALHPGKPRTQVSKKGAPKNLTELLKLGGGEMPGDLGQTLQKAVSSASKPISDLLEGFGIDGEKLIILMVLWTVFNENPDDKTLLLALGYLLL